MEITSRLIRFMGKVLYGRIGWPSGGLIMDKNDISNIKD